MGATDFRRGWRLALSCLLLAAGCSDETFSSTGDDVLVASAADSVDQATSESAVMIVATRDSPDTATAQEAAAAAAAGASDTYSPASCVSATQDGAQVTYTLNNCSGPYGLTQVSGEIVAVFTRVDEGLQIAATGTNLAVNQATLDLEAVAVYSRNGDDRELVVTTQSAGVTRRQRPLSRSGSYTVGWNDTTACLGVSGTWSTLVDDLSWSTAITGFERCGADCPSAGGSITYTNSEGNAFTVSYDGDDTAGWVSTRGRAGTMNLFCTP